MTGAEGIVEQVAECIQRAALARRKFDKLTQRLSRTFEFDTDDVELLRDLNRELNGLRVNLDEAARLLS